MLASQDLSVPLGDQGVGQGCTQDSDLEPGAQGDGSSVTRGGEPGGESLVLDTQGMGSLPRPREGGGECHPAGRQNSRTTRSFIYLGRKRRENRNSFSIISEISELISEIKKKMY